MYQRKNESREEFLVRSRAYRQEHKERLYAMERARRSSSVLHVLKVRFDSARKSARKKSLAFNITVDYLLEIYYRAPHCALTLRPFDLNSPSATISLDRIDCRGGYTIGNVRLLHWQVNAALNVYGDAAFDEMCRARAAILDQI